MAGTTTVTLGGLTLDLRPPRDLASAWDALALSAGSPSRGGAAALALCWPDDSLDRPRIRLSDCGYNAALFGGKVFEALAEKCDAAEILAVGRIALGVIAQSVATGPEVAAAKGFSKPSPSPAPSSPSSGAGGANRAGSPASSRAPKRK